jgi:hypothetical protein
MRLRRRDEVTALTIYASAMKTYWNCLIPRGAAPIMRICIEELLELALHGGASYFQYCLLSTLFHFIMLTTDNVETSSLFDIYARRHEYSHVFHKMR